MQVLVLPFVRRHKSSVRSAFNALNHADIRAVFARACKGEYMLQSPERIVHLRETDWKRRRCVRSILTRQFVCLLAGLRLIENTKHRSVVRAVAAPSLPCGLPEQQSQL